MHCPCTQHRRSESLRPRGGERGCQRRGGPAPDGAAGGGAPRRGRGGRAGAEPDRFDHWRWNSSVNQELLNGRYWKHLKRDGMTDRLTPANEAYSQLRGASHDRSAAPAPPRAHARRSHPRWARSAAAIRPGDE